MARRPRLGTSPRATAIDLDGVSDLIDPLPLDDTVEPPAGLLDVTGDGILIQRWFWERAGTTLTGGAPKVEALRTDAGAIAGYLDGNAQWLDVDGDGDAYPDPDGEIILRYLFGLRGAVLVGD